MRLEPDTTDLFAFLTNDPNDVIAKANPDSMPVILTTPDEIETWLTAPWGEARALERPLPPGVLRVVSVGPKDDPEPVAEPLLSDGSYALPDACPKSYSTSVGCEQGDPAWANPSPLGPVSRRSTS